MKNSRRQFIKTSGLVIAGTGIVPVFLESCKNDKGEAGTQPQFENMVKNVIPLEKSDFAARIENARKQLVVNGFDALYIEGGTNMKYFFNISWWLSERVFGAFIPAKGEVVWICPAFETERAMEQIPAGNRIYSWEEHESPYIIMKSIIKDLGISNGKLAMDPDVRSFVVEGIRRESGVQAVDGSVITQSCRALKSEKEIAFMDLANRITKLALQYGFMKMHEGMTKEELGRLFSDAHRQMGTSGGGGPAFGFTTAFPHGTKQNKNLSKGDIVLVDAGCSVEGYESDVSRTVVFGEPTDRQKKVYDAVLKAQQAAFAAVKPGVACGDIDLAARKVIEDMGFGTGYKYFAHRLGHGIGLDGHEYPYLVKDNPLKLAPGMTFSNEPGLYLYGEFGVRIEDCFAVTEDGYKLLGGMAAVSVDKPFGTA
jgi:Xaa-Pro dipeptidase